MFTYDLENNAVGTCTSIIFFAHFGFKMAHPVWDDRDVGRHKPKQPNSHQKSEDRLCAYVFLLLTLLQT